MKNQIKLIIGYLNLMVKMMMIKIVYYINFKINKIIFINILNNKIKKMKDYLVFLKNQMMVY